VSGGMYEIGDDLPSLGANRDRLALVENKDLLRMAKLSKASKPVDLMSYAPEDQQPSIFVLKENGRHATITVFNWTNQPRSHRIPLEEKGNLADDVFDRKRPVRVEDGALVIENQPPHSVRMIRFTNSAVTAAEPTVTATGPATAEAGDPLRFSAAGDAISYHWNFGDGVTAEGARVTHAYTLAGNYYVELTAEGVDDVPARRIVKLHVNGTLHTPFALERSRRYVDK
jgi:alpha-galactosidase